MQQSQIPAFLVAFLVAIALVNGVATEGHWYYTMRWLDMPMHFAGGVWLAWFGIWWQYTRRGVVPASFSSVLGVCLAFAVSVGILWEAYEAIVSLLTVGHMNAMLDTLGDLFFDTLGGTIVAIAMWVKIKNN